MLVRRGDVDGRGVVVGAEVRGDDPAAAFGDQPRQRDRPVVGEDRLRRLDHQLETGAIPAASPRARLERVAGGRQRRDLLRRRDFRQRDDEVRRQHAAGGVEQRGEEQIERAQAPPLQLLAERLDADADAWRQRAARRGGRDVTRRVDGKPIFFVIGPIAEPVLEIDPEVLDRLARQLVDEPRVDAVGERGDRDRPPRRACPPSGAYSASVRRAIAPSFSMVSGLNRCAPP